MSKASEMAKVTTRGTFNQIWGLVVSTIILAIATIFIGRLMGPDLYGLYSIALIAPTFIGVFRDWGLNSAMIRYIAQFRAENRENEIRNLLASGLIFEVSVGLALSVICFLLSDYLATSMFNRPSIAPLIQLASIVILANGVINAATALFTGIERLEQNSVMLVSQSIFKTVLVIALVLEGQEAAGAVIGNTASMLVAVIVGLLLVYLIYRKLPKTESGKLHIKAYISMMLVYSTPLSLAGIVSAFQTQFYIFLLPLFYLTSNVEIGNYQIASTFVVLIGFFASPITNMLFPAFSKLNPEKDKEDLKSVFQFSIKYASMLVVPAAALVMCLSQVAVATLFGKTYVSAPLFLALLAISYLYTAVGNLSLSNLIVSQGKTSLSLYLTLLTAAIGFPMGYLLIMNFGVLGLIAASTVAGVPSMIFLLYWTNKSYGISVDWGSSIRITISSTAAALSTYFVVSLLNFSSWVLLLIGAFVFAAILLPLILLTKAITRKDVENLKAMSEGLGRISRPIKWLLSLIEKAMSILRI